MSNQYPAPGAAVAPASGSFVLFPIGDKRFALPAEVVTELAHPGQLHAFPHTTPLLTGVLIRRGSIVPVCDVAPVLVGPSAPARRFYLIARRRWQNGAAEAMAIPVTGECELRTAPTVPPAGKLPRYVNALLSLEDEIVEVLDLETLMNAEVGA
jgi:chemotaxis signal transduction protein